MPTITANGVDLNVLIAGEGPAIVLVHGFPLDHTMWRGQIDHLAKSRRVIAPDLRGFGGSGAVDPAGVSMETFADDLAALLDALNISEPVCLCGLSMGGYIALAFVRKYRDRLSSLILCDTKATADDAAAKKVREQTALKVLENGPDMLAEAMAEKLFAESTRQQQPEVVKEIQDVIRATRRESVAAASRGMAARPDSTDLLPSIDLPTLVLVGEHDAITTSDEMRAMSTALPRATFVEIADAGHMAPLERPDAVNAAIDHFLG
jgi:3-oxoadipate enol-lactonase